MAEVTRWFPRMAVSACEELVTREAVLLQQPAGSARLGTLVEQRDEEVLDRDVLVLQPLGLLLSAVQQPAQSLGHVYLAGCDARSGHPGTAAELGLDVVSERARVSANLADEARHQTVWLPEERQQEVLSVDLAVTEPQRHRLRVVQCLLGLGGQAVHVHGGPPVVRAFRSAASSAATRSSRSTTTPRAA